MDLNSGLDYFIAISGFLIILVSFGWNMYDVFLRKSSHHAHSDDSDSAIR